MNPLPLAVALTWAPRIGGGASLDPAERGRGPYAVAAAGLLAPWGVSKDLSGCLRERTQGTQTPGRGRHYGKPISVRRKRKGWRMPPGRRRAERSSRRGEAEDGAAA